MARSSTERALNLTQKNGEKINEGTSRILLGRVLGKEHISQSARAKEYILEGIKILEEREVVARSAVGYLYLGELYADMGQKEKALETLKKAEGAFRKMGMDYWLRRTQKILGKLKS